MKMLLVKQHVFEELTHKMFMLSYDIIMNKLIVRYYISIHTVTRSLNFIKSKS